jgi:RHS repeat-associated protein
MGVVTRAYDGLGRTAGFSLFHPANPVNPVQSISYGYDPLGRFGLVTGFADGYSMTNRYGYLPGSDLLSGWSNGVVTVARSFEPNRDLLVKILNMAGTNRVSQFGYLNDAIGRRTQRLDTLAGYALLVTNEFGYNSRSELTSAAMGTNKFGYVFDSIGNRELERVNLTTNVYAANDLNQYKNILCVSAPPREDTPIYDADGNILKLRDWTLQWDAENRLVSASNATEVIHYQHDFMGRRVWREAAGVTHTFLYDGWALIQERTYTQTHTLTNTYFYGPDLSGELQGAGTIGGLWARVGEDGPLYYTYDGNGNVSDLVDASGAVRGHYEYAPFGGLTAMTGDLSARNPFRFSTKRQDESTSLLYYGYRDLDTVWGRWTARDLIEEECGYNLYAYVANAPLIVTDYLGLLAIGELAVLDCRKGTCRLEEGKLSARQGLPWFTDMSFLSEVAKSLLFTHDNYIESGFPVYGEGKYGDKVQYESALQKVNEAKIRLAPKLAEAKDAYVNQLKKIDSRHNSEKNKDRYRDIARKEYHSKVRFLNGTLVGAGGEYGNKTPLRIVYFPDMISNYHTHTISGPPSVEDRNVLLGIKNRLKSDKPIWAVFSQPDRTSADDCRKSELVVYSSDSPPSPLGGVTGTATGIFIRY